MLPLFPTSSPHAVIKTGQHHKTLCFGDIRWFLQSSAGSQAQAQDILRMRFLLEAHLVSLCPVPPATRRQSWERGWVRGWRSPLKQGRVLGGAAGRPAAGLPPCIHRGTAPAPGPGRCFWGSLENLPESPAQLRCATSCRSSDEVSWCGSAGFSSSRSSDAQAVILKQFRLFSEL